MSKLEELMAELCPDGVEFKNLADICVITRGRVMSKDYLRDNAGVYPVYSSQTTNNGIFGYIDNYDYDYESITWTTDGANAGSVFYHIKEKFSITNVCGLLRVLDQNQINTRFLYYCLQVTTKRYVNSGMGNPKLMSNVMAGVTVPLPPLPVQGEIVRILDNFTELTAELTAELSARKKQYEYYRDSLLSVDGKLCTLEEVCQIVDCPHSSPKWQPEGIPAIRNFNLVNGTIEMSKMSYVDEKEYQKRIKRITPQKDDILFSREAPIGNVGIIPENFVCCQGQRVVLLRPDQEIVTPRYLLYVLQGAMVKEQIYRVNKIGSTVSNFNIGDLKRLNFSIPAISIQKKIVDKLDAFSGLCGDIAAGLPAEIIARRKQYEYYRDRLLSFKNVGE